MKELLNQLTKFTTDESLRVGEPGHLDERTRSLVLLAAAVCSDSPTRTFGSIVASARRAGVTDQEVLGVLFSLAPTVGESRLVSVTPRISKALGYDVDRALEIG
ncbi:MAG TPA: carboxymuconolactone decarboxylase family protein [Acidimicrobiia bacterium]|nr:carboxymuconolactone decarboxylase family protein [Acidimicrobiia bacterium]